jgi:hypothetical protein
MKTLITGLHGETKNNLSGVLARFGKREQLIAQLHPNPSALTPSQS